MGIGMNRYVVINKSGEEMPPFGIGKLMKFSAKGGAFSQNSKVFEMEKPDESPGIYVVNGPVALPNGKKRAMIPWESATAVAVDSTVKFGDVIGPVEGSFKCTTDGTGYICQDVKESNNVVAVHYYSPTVDRGTSTGGGGACGCVCVSAGDLILDDAFDTETVTEWSIAAFGPIEERQANGSIFFTNVERSSNPLIPNIASIGQHILIWNASQKVWRKDVSKFLQAEYTDGTQITGLSILNTLTASLVFEKDNSGFTTLTLTINGTIPPKPAT